ncbi:MAG TPA: tetratricopeptide repeat protein [Candidatus Saccharimonadales bacterium]|nr:tetratricopeptide repeat protein [Candidatus Saccharimonadales bacterium]
MPTAETPAPRAPAAVSALRPRLALALALLAGAALYAPNLRAQLLADDYAFLSGALSTPLLRWLGTTAGVSYYRPLSRQLYVELMSRAFGTHPLPYHVVNLALLLLAAWLLARIAGRLAAPAAGVVAAGAFLAQHGASVLTGWAACAQDLFALTFTAASVLLQLSGRRRWAAAATAAGLLSKETAAAAPFLALLVEWRRPGGSLGRAARAAAPHFAVLAAWAVAYGAWFRHFPGAPPVGVLDLRLDPGSVPGLVQRAALSLVNLDQGLGWPRAAVDLARAAAAPVLGAAGVALATWGVARRRAPAERAAGRAGGEGRARREARGRGGRGDGAAAAPAARQRRNSGPGPLVWLGLGWMLLGILPVLLVGHRWSAYLTVMMGAGFALLAAAGLSRWPRGAAAAVGVLLLLGPAADAVSGGPFETRSPSVWTLARVRRLSSFVAGLRRTLQQSCPQLPPGSAVLLSRVPNISMVAVHGSDALRAWYADTTLTFGSIEAVRINTFRGHLVVLECDPSVEPNRWYVESPGFVRLRVDIQKAVDEARWTDARDMLERARRAPEWKRLSDTWRGGALLTLGQVYQRLNQPALAEPVYRQATREAPRLGQAHYGLGAVLALRGAYREAEPELAEAVRRMPDDALSQFTYGALLAQNGRDLGEAAAHVRRALELGLEEPALSSARRLLAQIEARLQPPKP